MRVIEASRLEVPVGETRSPLRHLDANAVSHSARTETRNREVHLPPISAYRWWARRTETINGGILDALGRDRSGRLLVVDPFAGGGVIPLAAAKRGHVAYAQDVNPWAVSGLVGMFALASVGDLGAAGQELHSLAGALLRDAYQTLYSDGSSAEISHTFRVATAHCPECGTSLRLFPHALVSLRVRRERKKDDAFVACPAGHLFEGRESQTTDCPLCDRLVDPNSDYTPGRIVTCFQCLSKTKLDQLAGSDSWTWEVVLVERVAGRRRELALPTEGEIRQAATGWTCSTTLGEIRPGQETNVLIRHGFKTWNDIYPQRQMVVIERLLELAGQLEESSEVIRALRLAILGSAEMAGHLSRWDRFYLKSYESMAGHRFNFTTFTAEPNVWGTIGSGRGSVSRRLVSLTKATKWFGIHAITGLKVDGPVLSSGVVAPLAKDIDVRVVEGSSERILLPDASADIVLTDPPYHDDVQYDELSMPLRAWAEQSLETLAAEAVVRSSSHSDFGIDDYRDLLGRIFGECHRILRPDGHLVFSFANRQPAAWRAVLAALDTARFRACGFAVLHSENETDVVKRKVRACTLDLLMDLVPAECPNISIFVPTTLPTTDEGRFLMMVGQAFLQVGNLDTGRLDALELNLRNSAFLTK